MVTTCSWTASQFQRPPWGGMVGIIGPNGAGKTTLFRLIPGRSNPTAERSDRRNGDPGIRRSEPDARPKETIWEEISGGAGDPLKLGVREVNSRPMWPVSISPAAISKKVEPVRRGAEPGPGGADVEGRRQCAPTGRTDQ